MHRQSAESTTHQTQSRLMAQLDQAYLRPAHVVESNASIVQVCQVFEQRRCTSVLVRGRPDGAPGNDEMGIFTATSLHQVVLDGRPLDSLCVGEWARYPVFTVASTATMGDAMALLLRHRVHRLVVLGEQGEVLGLLRALDLFSFVANQSHLLGVQIEQAQTLEALSQAAGGMTALVAALNEGGMRMELMCRLVQQLNARLFERAWEMIAPPELVANSCLFVMGSEGRGEQLLKTDQDNGLVLRDSYTAPPDLAQICERFSEALASFGYPPCPGNIMLSNQEWRDSVRGFGQKVRQWLLTPQQDSLMHLAIFLDAHAVAGDSSLLAQVRGELQALRMDNAAHIARFASIVEAFTASVPWWRRVFGLGPATNLSIKKAGIFPIVHGVRSLSLAEGVHATSTAERLLELQKKQVLDAQMAQALRESLEFFLGLRLQAGLDEISSGTKITGNVAPEHLSRLERQRLQGALDVVQRFVGEVLQQRLRLDLAR